MKVTLPMLWSALLVFAALVLLPWMLMPAAHDQSPVLESIRGRLERMTVLMEEQNRLLASADQVGPLADLMLAGAGGAGTIGVADGGHRAPQTRQPVGSADSLQLQTESELRLLIRELRSAVAELSQTGTQAASWQPQAMRASLHSTRERNLPALQAVMVRLADDDQGVLDEFYFRSMAEVLAEFGRPDQLYSNKGQFFVSYNNVPCTLDGQVEELDLGMRFADGICVYADIN